MTPFPLLDELPDVELQTTRLDGESYRLADAYLPIGIRPEPAVRATAALVGRSPRLIAALGTAAWIWGAARQAPARGEYLVDLAARWRPAPSRTIDITESVLHPDDVIRWGRAAVTTPLRTVIDLARFRPSFEERDARAVRELARIGSFDAAAAVAALSRSRNLSHKHLAAERIRAAFSPS